MTTSGHPQRRTDLAELETLAVELAREAGEFVAQRQGGGFGVDTKSTSTDLVTDVDAASERLLRERLAARRPDDAFFGEEGTIADPGGGGRCDDPDEAITWVVDPIDGTVNYVYGIPAYAVSVAAVVGDPHRFGAWRPVAGAVAQPSAGLVFHARSGGGAWVQDADGVDTPLAPTDATSLELTLLGTGFAYREDHRRRQAEDLVEILPSVRDIRRGGSAALDLCSVACGRLDAYYERGVNPWDIAAGWLVVTEAGGSVCGVRSPRPSAEGIIASAPGVHDALVARIEAATRASGGGSGQAQARR